ncbi:F510_1955 family glycosylhydrolase [Alkalihalobacillus pseudalcaliphilus]|uniref:F510_1955 family glycosylhydrolase n=1 Tax=Alkalihalobacillus pseudalcaliphilus TaxID=79884 RepID=UPI00064DA8F6|nr:hypothetical protein [Alkalihalobacillus pseudalcaliphilus]KMK76325.1 hypothetical protein AB990_14060 [Alkalihalobacillus pseudalcaliphilus]
MKWIQKTFLLTLISTMLTGCISSKDNGIDSFFIDANEEIVTHIHGIGYLGSNQTLFIATHHGLLKFSDDKWFKTNKNNHDYMGFQTTDNGFFSSGHPSLKSNLKNPLGIMKSTDQGNTLEKIKFYGEIDFHYLAASYYNHTLYVYNEHPNSLTVGLHYSIDGGESWQQSEMNGVSANSIGNIATHPNNPENISISTNKGLFVSSNFGNDFELLSPNTPVTTVEYQENSLIYFQVEKEDIKLINVELQNKDSKEIPLPEDVSRENPVLFLTTNPSNREEITLVTANNSIFQTKDNGQTWAYILENGKVSNN